MRWRKFEVGEQVRKDRMLAWALKCTTGSCDSKGAWSLGMLIDNHLSLCLLELGDMEFPLNRYISFGDGQWGEHRLL